VSPSVRPPLGPVSVGPVTDEAFEALVADALDEIPPELASAVENVAVVVAEWPTPSQLAGRRGTLLGLYEGIPLTHRDSMNYAGVLPDRITIFRGPLCALAADEEDLQARVRVTVLHEVGHYFGLSDDRLRELGWA
jgi:predicted Zn-dependent protease with MMP-like domain